MNHVHEHGKVAGHTMIAMPLVYSGFSGPQASKPSAPPACFQPLDPGILNASIPAFYIGRDADGFWLARDAKGESGGAFLLKSSALAFAKRMSRPTGCATIFLYERFELDLENQGNPLLPYLRGIKRRMALLSDRITRLTAATRVPSDPD